MIITTVIISVARSVEYIARAAKTLVINKPMAIFYPGDRKSWLASRNHRRIRDGLCPSRHVDLRELISIYNTV